MRRLQGVTSVPCDSATCSASRIGRMRNLTPGTTSLRRQPSRCARRRVRYLDRLAPLLKRFLADYLPELAATVEMRAVAGLEGGYGDVPPMLREARSMIVARAHTTRGPHRADWSIRFERARGANIFRAGRRSCVRRLRSGTGGAVRGRPFRVADRAARRPAVGVGPVAPGPRAAIARRRLPDPSDRARKCRKHWTEPEPDTGGFTWNRARSKPCYNGRLARLCSVRLHRPYRAS